MMCWCVFFFSDLNFDPVVVGLRGVLVSVWRGRTARDFDLREVSLSPISSSLDSSSNFLDESLGGTISTSSYFGVSTGKGSGFFSSRIV